jgi:CRISPR-associated protein Cas2
MRTLITFDISSDKRRYRVCKALLEYTDRVQESVFEAAWLSEAAYLRIRSRAERFVDPSTDSLRYYRLCGACVDRITHFGAGPGLIAVPEPFTVIGK